MSTVLENTSVTGNLVVIPWAVEKDNLPADLLHKIFVRLKEDDILPDLVPEYAIQESEFINFVTSPAVILNLFLDSASKKWAGLAWLTLIEEGDLIKKGCASIAFFREHWNPEVTRTFGRIVLSQWFSYGNFSLIYGLTPSTNVAAVKYTERVGFTYKAVLPNWCSRRGELCDGKVAMITKEEFYQQQSEQPTGV